MRNAALPVIKINKRAAVSNLSVVILIFSFFSPFWNH